MIQWIRNVLVARRQRKEEARLPLTVLEIRDQAIRAVKRLAEEVYLENPHLRPRS